MCSCGSESGGVTSDFFIYLVTERKKKITFCKYIQPYDWPQMGEFTVATSIF